MTPTLKQYACVATFAALSTTSAAVAGVAPDVDEAAAAGPVAQAQSERLSGKNAASSGAVYTTDGNNIDLTSIDDAYDGTLGSMASVTLNVPDCLEITDVDVIVDIAHTWAGDLVIKLESPNGTVVDLVSIPGFNEPADDGGTNGVGESSDLIFGNTYEFDDAAGASSETMGSGGENPIGSFVLYSSGFMNEFGLTTLNGEQSSGVWTLYVGDAATGDVGTLDGFTLQFAGGPCTAGGYEEGFEGYTCGSLILGQGGWETFNGDPVYGDNSFVTCGPDPVFAGANSMTSNPDAVTPEDLIQQFDDLNIGAGAVVRLSGQVFIPSDATGSTYFILQNEYEPNGVINWSTQLELDPDAGVIESEFENVTLPLITGQWTEIAVTIDLDANLQTIAYDNGLLSRKSWTEGLSGGGSLRLDALDLFGNTITAPVTYDDIEIYQIPETPNGWLVDRLPLWFSRDTTLEDNTCGFSAAGDAQFVVEVAEAGRYLFNGCSADFDDYLALGTTPCDFDVAESDSSEVCGGTQARIAADLDAGTYYLTLGSTVAEEGQASVSFREICVQAIDDRSGDAGVREDLLEPCGADENGGCNRDPNFFQPIALGEVAWGSFWYDGANRDTDWYELSAGPETRDVAMIADAESPLVIGKILDSEQQDCGVVEFINPFAIVAPCDNERARVVFTLEADTTIWLFAGSSFEEITSCGDKDNYWMIVTCTQDLNASGAVDFGDILYILGRWGQPGTDADLDGSGFVDFQDIVRVLGAWGPCAFEKEE